jgi:hypothetical protein
MKMCGRLIGFLALLLILLPAITAQEEKKDPEKKDEEKKPALEKKPAEEKFVFGYKLGPVKLLKAEGGDFDIEVQVPDPMKIYQFEMWKAQQMQGIMRQTNAAQAAQQMAQYQMQMVQKQANNETTSPKTVEMKAAEGMKVRLMNPPLQFDDQGNIKRYTTKQLAALRGKSKWPGYYPGDMDMLKAGQVVEVYVSKSSIPPPTKTKGAPKRKADLEAEAAAAATTKPEVVLIVVIQEPYPK